METLKMWWPVVVAAVGYIGWLIRMEARATQNTRDLKALEERLAIQRTEDLRRRDRDWDAMNKRLDELGADIKTLLQRTH